jgi:hypothetical protein
MTGKRRRRDRNTSARDPGLWFPSLQRAQGWGTHRRDGVSRFEAAPPALPATIKVTDHDRVLAAIELFRKRDATNHDRRNAVRMLADVLEPLRNQLSKVITERDESDLFHIANAFGIRHNNDDQKTQYDAVWLSWMFYHYLSTIHVVTRRLKSLAGGPPVIFSGPCTFPEELVTRWLPHPFASFAKGWEPRTRRSERLGQPPVSFAFGWLSCTHANARTF